MSLLLILLVLVILLGCGGGFYGSRVGWWGGNRSTRGPNGGPTYQGGNPGLWSAGSATPPGAGNAIAPNYNGQQQPYAWNPLYTIILVIIVICLIGVLLSFLGGYWVL